MEHTASTKLETFNYSEHSFTLGEIEQNTLKDLVLYHCISCLDNLH